MGWVKKKTQHVCSLPDKTLVVTGRGGAPKKRRRIAKGSVWQCDECQRVYKMVDLHRGVRKPVWLGWEEQPKEKS